MTNANKTRKPLRQRNERVLPPWTDTRRPTAGAPQVVRLCLPAEFRLPANTRSKDDNMIDP
jgi:hypothetical protein